MKHVGDLSEETQNEVDHNEETIMFASSTEGCLLLSNIICETMGIVRFMNESLRTPAVLSSPRNVNDSSLLFNGGSEHPGEEVGGCKEGII